MKSTRFGVLIFVGFGVLTFLAHWETHNEDISHGFLAANDNTSSLPHCPMQEFSSGHLVPHTPPGHLQFCRSSSGRCRISDQYLPTPGETKKKLNFFGRWNQKKRAEVRSRALHVPGNLCQIGICVAHDQNAPPFLRIPGRKLDHTSHLRVTFRKLL